MSNSYKIVKVEYSLEEYGINNIDVVKSEFGVDDVVKGVFKYKDELYYEIKIIDEENDIGVLSYEDESILLVIGDKSEWYNKVEQFNLDSIEKEVDFSNGDYNEEDWDDWVEFVYSIMIRIKG
tara:strand:+ start:808 stop:1176 length:369 start_codon:yes stop_codon:yes gene_type:complete